MHSLFKLVHGLHRLRSEEGSPDSASSAEVFAFADEAPTTTETPASESSESAQPQTETDSFDFSQTEETANVDQPQQEEETSYEIEWSDSFVQNDELRSMLSAEAKTAGLDPQKATAFLNSIYSKINEDAIAQQKQYAEALKEEWGSNYELNKRSVSAFFQKLEASGKLPEETRQLLSNPSGYRLLHALQNLVGEGGLKSKEAQSAKQGDLARAMLDDPNNEYYEAIRNPSHPKFREASRLYNKDIGIN